MTSTTRVVVIEDDVDLREALCLMLQFDGHETVGFSNAREAIRQLEGGLQADVILLDLMMPIMTGWEFCEYRAGSPTLAKIPVIVVTARHSVTPPIGIDELLLKPFDPDRLQETIARVVAVS
jgi:CheY-like chemotaxis protein